MRAIVYIPPYAAVYPACIYDKFSPESGSIPDSAEFFVVNSPLACPY